MAEFELPTIYTDEDLKYKLEHELTHEQILDMIITHLGEKYIEDGIIWPYNEYFTLHQSRMGYSKKYLHEMAIEALKRWYKKNNYCTAEEYKQKLFDLTEGSIINFFNQMDPSGNLADKFIFSCTRPI